MLLNFNDNVDSFVALNHEDNITEEKQAISVNGVSVGNKQTSNQNNSIPFRFDFGSKRPPRLEKDLFNDSTEIEEGWKNEDVMVDSKYFPSSTDEALQSFDNIRESIYIGSATGRSMAEESMPCECKYDSELDDPNNACGNDNKCINRMMFMECMVQDCSCGHLCRNRRFQLAQYATVDVIKTEKKGYGLRALVHLPINSFVMEYIGEVISQDDFIKRTKEYDKEGYKHYYFMTLKNDEIIDATKKGCLARFMNHSCNPNCVSQKWVIGKKMRIGVFTNRAITAGEELTFDYKFERYGAKAQDCYCGEVICKGYIGVTTEEKKSLDLSSDDDEEEVIDIQPKLLQDPNKVQIFVKRMLNSVGKPQLVNKLLERLLKTKERSILKTIVRLHGLKMLKFWLGEWKHHDPIILKVLLVLEKLPLVNRNGLEDCQLFDIVQKFVEYENKEVRRLSQCLLNKWNELKSVYRIPKRPHVELVLQASDNSCSEEEHSDKEVDSIKKQYMKSFYKTKRRRIRYESTRDYFDPNNDYFEYFSMNVTPEEISQKIGFIRYQPRRTNSHNTDLPLLPDTSVPIATIDYYNYYFYQEEQQWQTAIAEDGSTYYYHTQTQETQWHIPEEILAMQYRQYVPPPPPPPQLEETPPPPPPPLETSHLLTPTSASDIYLNDIELKRQVGGVVTKYLSSKQRELWNGDKQLFKGLARKMTHHIVDKEVQSGRKIKSIDSSLRLKIEKFIDAYVTKIKAKN